MSRSARTTWNQRVQKRLARATGQAPLSAEALEAALAAVARKMRLDPVLLLGSLAAKPIPTALWHEVLRNVVPQAPLREEDWGATFEAADVIAAAFPEQGLSAWVVEPAQPGDVFILASCLALRSSIARLEVVATHSDPRLVEIGRSGLLSESTVARAPSEVQIHFRHLGRCWQAVPELRAAVRFEGAPPCELPGMHGPEVGSGFHLIVSRGQLARVERDVAQRLALRLSRSLREEGFLLVGPGDHDDHRFGEMEPYVAPGVLLYRKGAASHAVEGIASDFASLLTAVEADPVAWEPRWQLACLLLREGYAESAMAHLRELARWRPEFPGVWHTLAKAYTLAGDTASAAVANNRASHAAESAGAPKLLM